MYLQDQIFHFNRQQEKLKEIMNASGSQEKVPSHIQEVNATKLAKLLQEIEVFKKESERIESEEQHQL